MAPPWGSRSDRSQLYWVSWLCGLLVWGRPFFVAVPGLCRLGWIGVLGDVPTTWFACAFVIFRETLVSCCSFAPRHVNK